MPPRAVRAEPCGGCDGTQEQGGGAGRSGGLSYNRAGGIGMAGRKKAQAAQNFAKRSFATDEIQRFQRENVGWSVF